MELLQCKVCNGNELREENGMYVCQNCRCQYPLEQAKKLLIVVDDPVAPPKDSSENERLLVMAQDCLNRGILDEARKLYTKVTENCPTDWRGWWGLVQSCPVGQNDISISPDNRHSICLDIKSYQFEIKEAAYLNSFYNKALTFAPSDQQQMILDHQQNRKKKLEAEIPKARMRVLILIQESLIRTSKTEIEKLNIQLKNVEQRHQNNTEAYQAERRRTKKGITMLVIATPLCILSLITQAYVFLIPGGILGIIGFFFLTWDIFFNEPNPNTKYNYSLNELQSLQREVSKEKENLKGLEKKLANYQQQLSILEQEQ